VVNHQVVILWKVIDYDVERDGMPK